MQMPPLALSLSHPPCGNSTICLNLSSVGGKESATGRTGIKLFAMGLSIAMRVPGHRESLARCGRRNRFLFPPVSDHRRDSKEIAVVPMAGVPETQQGAGEVDGAAAIEAAQR